MGTMDGANQSRGCQTPAELRPTVASFLDSGLLKQQLQGHTKVIRLFFFSVL